MFSSCPNPPFGPLCPAAWTVFLSLWFSLRRLVVETLLEVAWLWFYSPPHVPKSSVSPLPLWKWCAHLGTSSFVAADARFECVSLPLHSRTAHPPPLILGSLPFPSLSPVWSYILLFSALPMKRKGIVARLTVSDRPK